MRPIDWIALAIGAVALLAFAWLIVAVICKARWDRDFRHDKALLEHDPSGDLWRERGRL